MTVCFVVDEVDEVLGEPDWAVVTTSVDADDSADVIPVVSFSLGVVLDLESDSEVSVVLAGFSVTLGSETRDGSRLNEVVDGWIGEAVLLCS